MRMIFRCDPALSDHLPRPVAARSALPDWLRAMPAKAAFGNPRPRHPHRQAMPAFRRRDGLWRVMILLPCDMIGRSRFIFVGMGHSGAGDLRTSARALELSRRGAVSAMRRLRRDGQAAIKFNSFWTIELEPGWSLFATHPVNRDDLPFRLISGLVDADRFHDGGINFPGDLDAAGFFRRAAQGHAGGAVLRGAARRAAA